VFCNPLVLRQIPRWGTPIAFVSCVPAFQPLLFAPFGQVYSVWPLFRVLQEEAD
jgi:hypothetical protein